MAKYKITGCLIKYDTPMIMGRKIAPGAFKDQNGTKIPVITDFCRHEEVIGYAELEDRPDGIYITAYLNDQKESDQVIDKIRSSEMHLGMYANQLKIDKDTVFDGKIREACFNQKCDDASWIDTVEDLT